MEAVHRRDHREAGSAAFVRSDLDQGGDRRLAGAGRACDSEQEPLTPAVDSLEQLPDAQFALLDHPYSLLEAAQMLIPLSVAYLSISASSSGLNSSRSRAATLVS